MDPVTAALMALMVFALALVALQPGNAKALELLAKTLVGLLKLMR